LATKLSSLPLYPDDFRAILRRTGVTVSFAYVFYPRFRHATLPHRPLRARGDHAVRDARLRPPQRGHVRRDQGDPDRGDGFAVRLGEPAHVPDRSDDGPRR